MFFLLIPASDEEGCYKILVVFVFNCFIRQVVAVNKEIVAYAVCDRLLIYSWKKKLLFAFSPPELLSAFVQRHDTTPSSLPETHCIRKGTLLYNVLWVLPQPSLTGQTVSGRREDNTVNSLKIWWRGLIDQKKNLSGSWDFLGELEILL